ncbi:MAG: immune inhibitor A, partial [Chloroflexi bacterium]|nr:immune inhibitor A [Chloroflexota bacterium]
MLRACPGGKALTILSALLVLALGCTGDPLPSPTGTSPPAVSPTSSPTATPSATPLPTPTATPPPTASPTPTPTPPPEGSHLPEAPDRDLFALAQRLRLKSDEPIPRIVNPEPVSYQEGRMDAFWVTDLVSLEVSQVEAELIRVSDHAYWYFERGFNPPEEALERAVAAYEDIIYPTVTDALGTEWTPGVDNDTHLTIFHAQLRGAAGYYSATDEYPKAVQPLSNEREMVYINLGSFGVGSTAYLGTLAHELQHAVHWAGDPHEETWVNEGLSEVAKGLAGYGFSFVRSFVSSPTIQLTSWPSSRESTLPYYGGATLFMEYLAQHYGGHSNLRSLVELPQDGIQGIDTYLGLLGYTDIFEDVFKKWLVANYLDPMEIGDYYYGGIDVQVSPGKIIEKHGAYRGSTPQYAGEYIDLGLPDGDTLLTFQGQPETPLLPTTVHSGSYCWWGNRGDSIDSTLTAEFDLSQVSQATLSFWAWYAIEESWDYAYVEVSTDGGGTWDILEGEHASPENPVGASFGPGYTGLSRGWLEDSVDLTPYAGGRVLVRFEYVTDDAINEDGICIDDISIPEIGFLHNAENEGEWEALGFVRTNNRVPQRYIVQVVEMGEEVNVR